MKIVYIFFGKFFRFLILALVDKLTFALSTDQYMTHYWPMSNGQMQDIIGNADMIQGSQPVTFSSDRFGTQNSAIQLSNEGFTQVPSGIYFNSSAFTISVWIYPMNPDKMWARIVDFGNDQDNIFLTIGSGNGILNPCLSIYKNKNKITDTVSSQSLINSQWQLLTASFDGTKTNVYINGSLMSSDSVSFWPQSVPWAINYIGKRYKADDGYASSLLDDLRFYNKSLDQKEITDLINLNPDSTISLFSNAMQSEYFV